MTKMDVIIDILMVGLAGWCVIATLMFLNRVRHPEHTPPYWVLVGAFIGMSGFCTAAFWVLLFFIPPSWGTIDDSGEFESLRLGVAILLGLCGCLYVWWIIGKHEILYRENQRLKSELQQHPKTTNTEPPA